RLNMQKRALAAREVHLALLDLKKVVDETAQTTDAAELEAVLGNQSVTHVAGKCILGDGLKFLPALARVTRRDRCVTHFQFRDRVNFPVGETLQRRSKMFARQQRRLVKMTGVQHQPAGD